MNIEERLQALVAEAKEMPEQMNMERIRRRTKRRSMIRVIGTIGKVAAALFVVFSVSLGIGVNSSVVFAKTVADIPVIGSYSQLLIVRPDIKEALLDQDHEDLEGPISNGRLNEVHISTPGENTDLTLTLDSFLADEIAFTGFFKLDGVFSDKGYYALGNMRITDLDSGEELNIIEEYRIFENNDKFYLNRFYWDRPASHIALDFDLTMTSYGEYTGIVLEHYHIELSGIDITPANHFVLDRDVSVEGHDVHLNELLISESGTIVTYEIPNDFQLLALEIQIRDKEKNILSESLPGIAEFANPEGTTRSHILSSFYFTEVDTVEVYVESAFCSFCDYEFVRIDTEAKTATYQGNVIPIGVFYGKSYSDYGLPDIDFSDPRNTVLFQIPSDGLPDLNSVAFPDTGSCSFDQEYPHVVIDNTDYIIIQCPTYFFNSSDFCYYFTNGTESETYPVGSGFEIDIT